MGSYQKTVDAVHKLRDLSEILTRLESNLSKLSVRFWLEDEEEEAKEEPGGVP